MGRKLLVVLFGAVAILVLVYVVLALLARPTPEHRFFAQFRRHPLVMAHRGGRGLWPENTMFAFQQAVDLGVDVLEMDVHSTADGVLVVLHDSTVDRTTDGSGPVQELTLAELKKLDAGYNWSADDGQTRPYRGQGIQVPALEEVFAAFPAMAMNIEIKQEAPSIAAPLCQMIRNHNLQDRVLIASFSQPTIKEFRKECPEVATSAGQNEVIALFALAKVYLEGAYSPATESVQVPEYRSGLHVITPRFVSAAHNRNLQVHAWTINEADDMRRMLDLGIDGLITDYPDRLLELVGR